MSDLFLHKLFPAVAWTLLHSLWQGLVLVILAGMVILFTRKTTAAYRYGLLCGLFFFFLGGVVLTFIFEFNNSSKIPGQGLKGVAHDGAFPSFFPVAEWIDQTIRFLNVNASWIVLTWFIVLMLKAGKMIREMAYIKTLRSHKTNEADENWIHKIQGMAGELGIKKPVLLLESAMVHVPVIVGHLKPLILVPIGMLNHMPATQVEAVLLHELAHIRRHDYLVNIIQRLAELVLFFNPALLWLSSLIRAERENCCDEMAISRTGNRQQFLEALIHCKEYAMQRPAFALGFFAGKSVLVQRFHRIVNNSNTTLSKFELAFFILSIVMVAGLATGISTGEKPLKVVNLATIPNTNPGSPFISDQYGSFTTGEKIRPVASSKPSRISPPPLFYAGNEKHEVRELINVEEKSKTTEVDIDQNNDDLFSAGMEKEFVQKLNREKEEHQRQSEMAKDRKQVVEIQKHEAMRLAAIAERDRAMAEREKAQAKRMEVNVLINQD